MIPETRKSAGLPRWALLAAGGGLLLVAAWAALGFHAPGAASGPPTAASKASPAVPSPSPVAAASTGAAPTAAPASSAGLLARPIRYAALGASDTVGIGTNDPSHLNWTARLRAQLPADTIYRRFAQSGITLYDATSNQVPAAVRFQPTLVTVWLVVNDLFRGVPLPVYQKEFHALLDRLTTETAATVVVLNVPDISNLVPANGSGQTRQEMRGVAQQWNTMLATTAAPYGHRVMVVDLFGPSQASLQHSDWISSDGFHPSAAGYEQMANVTATALRQAGLIP